MKVWATNNFWARCGGDSSEQTSAVVAARSKTRAAQLLGLSLYSFNTYAGETGDKEEIETAIADPEHVFYRPIDAREGSRWWKHLDVERARLLTGRPEISWVGRDLTPIERDAFRAKGYAVFEPRP